MKKIGIIINPHAKKNMKSKIKPAELFKQIGGDYVEIRETGSLDEIYSVAEEFKSLNIDYIGISGGDGTIHHVISRFIHVYKENIPPIIILKGGTMDTVSRSINLKGKGLGILKKLVKKLESGDELKIFDRNTIKIDDKYCFLFGLGVTTNFLNQYYKGGDTGTWKAVKVAVKGVATGLLGGKGGGGLFSRTDLKVKADGKDIWFNDFLAILGSTVESVGISFKPFPNAYDTDDQFQIWCTGIKPIDVALNINKIRTGKGVKHPNHYSAGISRLEILGPKKFQYMMDGDLYEANTKLLVESGPQVQMIYV